MVYTFSRLSSQKKGDLLFYKCVVIFLSFYRVLLLVLWETQIVLNWVYLRVIRLNFVGFWGVGRGLSTGLRLFV